MEYRIVKAETEDHMMKQVNVLLEEGFHLSGDTNFFSVRVQRRTGFYIETTYHQVMLKRADITAQGGGRGVS